MFACAGRAGERQRGAVGCAKGSPWEGVPMGRGPHGKDPPPGHLVLEEGVSLWQPRQHHAVTDREKTGGNNGRDNTCKPEEIFPPTQPRLAPGAAAAAGVGRHQGHACSSTAVRTQPAVMEARANAILLPTVCACAHKTALLLEKPWSVSPGMQSLFLPLSCPCITWEQDEAHQSAKLGTFGA